MSNIEGTIREKVIDFVRDDELNSMPAHGGIRIYDEPLIAFADAADSKFDELTDERVLGPQFIAPTGWLAGAQSVISYFLPFTREIRLSNRTHGMPSEEWVSARIDGEVFNNALGYYIARLLREWGYEAVVPMLDSRFALTVLHEGEVVVSNWSERHVAYIAGLGEFGLHRGLITEKGVAGRLGSVVASLRLPPTVRTYSVFFDNCPYLMNGKCGVCIQRCPIGAITPQGKDKMACSRYINSAIKPKFAPRYGCAKCNTAVPCEAGIPRL